MNIEELREALADRTELLLASDDLYGSRDALDKLDVIVEAARAYADLLDNGTPIRRCVEHDAPVCGNHPNHCGQRHRGSRGMPACAMVNLVFVALAVEEEK